MSKRLALITVALLGLAACGSNSKAADTSAAASTTTEKYSDADVVKLVIAKRTMRQGPYAKTEICGIFHRDPDGLIAIWTDISEAELGTHWSYKPEAVREALGQECQS